MISAAFFSSYAYAASVRSRASGLGTVGTAAAAAPANVDPRAKVEGGVQKLYVDSSSSFNPQTLFAKPGMPLKIRFGQGGGCTYAVQFRDLGVYKDLTRGGAEVDLPALKPGQYQFSCGMNMLFGVLVVG